MMRSTTPATANTLHRVSPARQTSLDTDILQPLSDHY